MSESASTRAFEGAGATGLEPATSGVTGRRSNQLSYAPSGDGKYANTRTAGAQPVPRWAPELHPLTPRVQRPTRTVSTVEPSPVSRSSPLH